MGWMRRGAVTRASGCSLSQRARKVGSLGKTRRSPIHLWEWERKTPQKADCLNNRERGTKCSGLRQDNFSNRIGWQ